MEELSIREETLDIIRQMVADRQISQEVAEKYFPQLKESEDEKVRKALICGMSALKDQKKETFANIPINDCIAWLEKQGEQKPADKVEPKFRVGDWVIDKQGITHQIANVVENVTNHTYGYDTVDGEYFNDYVEGIRLWTIQDAKAGDVLIDKSGSRECPFIFKETKPSDIKTDMLNPLTVLGYCGIGGAGFTKGSGWGDTANCIYYPATKEQRDLLFQKMKEAGYEWDAEHKQLKKIEPKKEELTEFEEIVEEIADTSILNAYGVKELAKRLLFNAKKQLQEEFDKQFEQVYKNADEVQYKRRYRKTIDKDIKE